MRAALVTGKETIELREFPEPTPDPGKAVVQISHCGICGTDLHPFHTGAPYNPAICGHEWAGTVSAVGAGVADVREGDRVGVGVASACGQCSECRAGDASHCMQVLLGMLGIGPLAAPHGGFASAIAVDAKRLYPVRRELSDVEAGMLEPATVAVHALRRTPLRLGEAAVVLGAGPIGLLVLQCARAAGAGAVVVVEPDASRAKLAADLGASVVLDPDAGDFDEQLRAHCGAIGPDIVFECAGIPTTIDRSAAIVRRGGTVALVGMATVPAEISPMNWLAREVKLVASLGYLREEFEYTMGLVADGRLKVAPLHSRSVGLEGLSDAFHALLSGDGDVKVLFDPTLD